MYYAYNIYGCRCINIYTYIYLFRYFTKNALKNIQHIKYVTHKMVIYIHTVRYIDLNYTHTSRNKDNGPGATQ